ALTGPGFKPQIGTSRCTVLGQNHPVAAIVGTFPNAASIACDSNRSGRCTKTLQLIVHVWVAIRGKMISSTDIILSSHSQVERIECAWAGDTVRRVRCVA